MFPFHLFQDIFWFPFWFLLLPIGWSGLCYLKSTYLYIFQFSVTVDFYFQTFVVGKGTWNDLNPKFAKTYSVALHTIYSGECSVNIWEECVFSSCWSGMSYISVRSILSQVWLRANVSFLIFCLDDFSISECVKLKSVSPFRSASIWLIHSDALILGVYVIVISSLWVDSPIIIYNLLYLLLPFLAWCLLYLI